MTNALVVVPDLSIESYLKDGKLKLPEEELKRRDELVAESTAITKLNTESDRDRAINTSARLKGLEAQMDEAHKLAKRNFWAMCQAIDEAKRNFSGSLTTERERLNRMVGQFEAECRAAALRYERELAFEKHRLAEEARKLQEQAAATTDFEASLEVEVKAQELVQQAETLDRDISLAVTAKATGGAQRIEIEVRVTDVEALYKAKPHLVVLQPDITAIKYEINHRLPEGGTLPGVTFTKVPVFAARKR